jgi:hypothetical protein
MKKTALRKKAEEIDATLEQCGDAADYVEAELIEFRRGVLRHIIQKIEERRFGLPDRESEWSRLIIRIISMTIPEFDQ